MALEIISTIHLDLKHPNTEVVHSVQYDTAGRIKAYLLNDGEAWEVPAGVDGMVSFRKSDNIGGFYDTTELGENAVSIDGSDRSIIYITLDEQTTTTATTAGHPVQMQVNFYNTQGKRLSTFAFQMQVQASAVYDSDIQSQWTFRVLSQALGQVIRNQEDAIAWMEENIRTQAGYVVDDTLKVSGAAGDAKKIGELFDTIVMVSDTQPESEWNRVWIDPDDNDVEIPTMDEINDLKSAKANVSDVSYIDQKTVGHAEKTGDKFIIGECDPRNFINDTDTQGVIHGINRFNINTAVFSMSGYGSSYTITKENNGIRIETTINNTTSSHYAKAEYVAEFDGLLYLSCDAKLVSGKVNVLCMMMKVNGTIIERTYGEGLLYIAANVNAGDTVEIGFYGHIREGVASISAYTNIMLAYGGLYHYTNYVPDSYTGEVVDVISEKALTTYISDASYQSTPKWVYFTELLPDAIGLPASNNNLPTSVEVVSDISLPIVPYTTLYGSTQNGISITTTGSLAIRVDSMNKTALTAWLAEHLVTIKYKTGETSSGSLISPEKFQQGIVLTYSTVQTIKYRYTKKYQKGTILFFGDSITGMFAGNTSYTDIINMESGYDTINCGFSGTGYCDHSSENYLPFSANRLIQAVVDDDYSLQDASSLVNPDSTNYNPLYAEHLQKLKSANFNNIDYVVFFYGTNDWGTNTILLSDDDPSTEEKQRTNVQDAVIYCIGQLIAKYPNLRVLVVAPYWRSISDDKDSNIDPNTNGVYLYEFSDKIVEFASTYFNVPTINLYRSFGANAITNRYFTKDGTHPNERGKHIIADRIMNCISLY